LGQVAASGYLAKLLAVLIEMGLLAVTGLARFSNYLKTMMMDHPICFPVGSWCGVRDYLAFWLRRFLRPLRMIAHLKLLNKYY
jgi:hypothetical protein